MFQKKLILRIEKVGYRVFNAINLLQTHARHSDHHNKNEKGNKYQKYFESFHILRTQFLKCLSPFNLILILFISGSRWIGHTFCGVWIRVRWFTFFVIKNQIILAFKYFFILLLWLFINIRFGIFKWRVLVKLFIYFGKIYLV